MSGDDREASRPRAEGRALHDAAAEVPDRVEVAPPVPLPAVTPEELSKLPVFADLPDDARAWFAEHADHVKYAAGARVFEAAEPARNLFVVLDGVLQLFFELGGQQLLVSTHTRGSVTGMLPFSRMTHYNVRGVAAGELRLVALDRDRFPELLRLSPEIGQRLVALMSDRVRDATQMQQQREKMTALGKLSAGLAHELNNPAAAVRRAASALRERLDALPTLTSRLAAHGFGADAVCAADALRAAAREGRGRSLRALERSEREESVGEWLEGRGVRESWRRAPVLVDAGLAPEQLDSLSEGVPAEALGDLLEWLEASLEADRLADEIGDAATRISELVASVKTYSHMDRATDMQPVRVEAGLDATLTMLAHKVRKKSVRLEREGGPLPEIQAQAGELNQVWTNLFDNALDAVPEGGTIRLETGTDDGAVWVRIVDDGPGIPPEIQTRIFEPFFTTKGVGQGTGLGLDVVQRIVELHQGQLSLESRPGRTAFTVRLPIAPGA